MKPNAPDFYKYKKVNWTFEYYGGLVRLTAKADEWEQHRMFWFKTEKTREQKEQRMLKELENLRDDLVERVTFIFRAKRGDFDDKEAVEIDWRKYL